MELLPSMPIDVLDVSVSDIVVLDSDPDVELIVRSNNWEKSGYHILSFCDTSLVIFVNRDGSPAFSDTGDRIIRHYQ